MHDSSIIVVGEVDHKSRLYKFTKFIEYDSSLLLTHANESSRVWNDRFGHLNFRYMQRLSKQGMVKGLLDIQFSEGVCEGCILGKHLEEKFEKGRQGEPHLSWILFTMIIMGSFPHLSINKARYVLTFIDDYSRYTWVYFLRQKSQVFENLKDFKALVETKTGKKIKILHTNDGGDYINKDVQNLCCEYGI
jgi:transposase InsO family protein